MNASIGLKLFEITKEFVKDTDKAKEFAAKIEETIDQKFNDKSETLASKSDINKLENKIPITESNLLKTIYIVGLVQFLAIVGLFWLL